MASEVIRKIWGATPTSGRHAHLHVVANTAIFAALNLCNVSWKVVCSYLKSPWE